MTKTNSTGPKLSRSQTRLQRYNRNKVIRTVLQIIALCIFIALVVFYILRSAQTTDYVRGNAQKGVISATQKPQGETGSFIAISYPGLTKSTSLKSKIVNQAIFMEQINALKSAGYVTITQNDILNYYHYYGSLPKKSLFIIFEDGLMNTTSLAQDTLLKNNYIATVCTYANNLNSVNSKFITTAILKSLENVKCWETGSNGFRLAYMNIFDRYNNFFDQLNAEEFVSVHQYLWRDYNHYLMDFIRDKDRLRTEAVEELQARIKSDYDDMRSGYTTAIDTVPALYILMHSNTSAFGTDPIASEANRVNLTGLFAMNFNREGTCFNSLDSSIYDLSRLQVQSYFSTNHMLMRIQDDIGEKMSFVTDDEEEAKRWYLDEGAAQFKGNQIILTSTPQGRGQLTLKSRLFYDLDMTVTLTGNLVGRQSIYLRTDRNWERGIEVALVDNNLEVWDLSDTRQELFHQNLFEFDGGPFISMQEDEHNGLVALQKAIIQFDEDSARIAKAQAELIKLEHTPVLTLADGGTPYYPENDTTDRAARKIRIRIVGGRMSLWIDDKPVVDQLKVPGVQLGAISLGAEVFQNHENRYTQHNIFDDVYDAIFNNLVIRDVKNPETILYKYTLAPDQTINSIITGWVNSIINFFVDHF